MEQFNFYQYMLDVSTRLKDIGHTEDEPHFFEAQTQPGMQDMVLNLPGVSYPAHVILDTFKGRIGDENRSNNYLDNPFYTGFIITAPVQGMPTDDFIRAQKEQAKTILMKILAKMKIDRRMGKHGLNYMKFLSIPYQGIGPIGAGSYGIMYSIEVPHDHRLPYNENDWIPES